MPDASEEFSCYPDVERLDGRAKEMTMRILIAEDVPTVRNGLQILFELQEGLEVLGAAADANELISLTEKGCPDAVLIGWELPELAGIQLLKILRRTCPNLAVIVLSGRPEARNAALAAGANLFISKASPPEQLLASILSIRPETNEIEKNIGEIS
jgi:DNA-binding NarL/FixJ family response regulator